MRGNVKKHPYNLEAAIKQFERDYLINILQLNNGNKAKASEMLGVHIVTLKKKIKEHQIAINRI